MPILIDELVIEAEPPPPAPGAQAPAAAPSRTTPGQAERLMQRALLVDRQTRLEVD